MTDRLQEILRERFGLDTFRGRQREIIEHVLAGHDALVVMPTGSGKSLLYQVPALVVPGRTLVLSPLIALMKDQVDALRRKGIPASFVNSSLERAERERRIGRFVRGETPLLYVTPERFRSDVFREAVQQVEVSLLAVDEAHCATEWGHDFRPDYSRIHGIRELLGNPPTLALTATATPDVQREILRLVGIPDATLFHAGIERPNLFLSAQVSLDQGESWDAVKERLRRLPGAGIVYGTLIKDLHRLEDFVVGAGRRPFVYHGGLSAEERKRMQERFMHGAGTRVLATPAFGMGIDKADIRFILHHQIPGSVEAYYQEIGRAGRDGLPSFCELYYCEHDLPIQTQFIDWSNPDQDMLFKVVSILREWGDDVAHFEVEDLRKVFKSGGGGDGRVDTCLQWLEVLGVTEGSFEKHNLRVVRELRHDEIPEAFRPDKKPRDLRRLLSLVEYVRADECRRVWLARYFGLPEPAGDCGACDHCTDREEWLGAHLTEAAIAAAAAAQEAEGKASGRRSGAAPPAGSGEGLADPDTARLPERGDFVRVDGHHLGRVLRVSGRGERLRVEVELSTTLTTRAFPLRKHRIQVLDGPAEPDPAEPDPAGGAT